MTQCNRITHIMGLFIALFLFTLAPNEAQPQEITLVGLGPSLQEESVRQALVRAVQWETHLGTIYGDPYLPVVLIVEDKDPIYNYEHQSDPQESKEPLDQRNNSGSVDALELTLLYDYDPDTAKLAALISKDLSEEGLSAAAPINVKIFEAGSSQHLFDYVAESVVGENILILLGLSEP